APRRRAKRATGEDSNAVLPSYPSSWRETLLAENLAHRRRVVKERRTSCQRTQGGMIESSQAETIRTRRSFFLQPFARLGQRLTLPGGRFGELEVERPDGVREDTGDDGVAGPLGVRGNDVPGSPLGAGGRERLLEGAHVVVPVVPFRQIAGGELPALPRVVEPFEEALFLHLLGNVQKELDEDGAVARQVALEGVDVLVAALPEGLAALARRQLLALQQARVDIGDQYLLIIVAVKGADSASFRQAAHAAPDEVVVEILVGRLLEAVDLAALRFDARHDVLDRAVLAGRVHRLQDLQQREGVTRPEQFLGPGQLLQVLGQELVGLFLRHFLAELL